jgi:hypothetical protein
VSKLTGIDASTIHAYIGTCRRWKHAILLIDPENADEKRLQLWTYLHVWQNARALLKER